MKRFLASTLPLYLVVIVLVALGAGVALFFYYFRPAVLNYDLELPKGDGGTVEKLEYGSWPALQNADFFRKVKENFVSQRASFIEANLSEMKIRVYEKGLAVAEYPILTKGKEGSWWETPAGLYKVEGKTPKAYSSFAHVYMPWAMPFQGNFLIHGWPYYPDGTPVETRYSGGCLRLSDQSAKAMYDSVKVGTPVLVYEKSFSSDDFKYKAKTPEVSARNFLAADLKNNFVFFEKEPGEVRPIASLTKLITALVATEYINLEKKITITDDMIVKTSKPRLISGESLSAYDLLFPLLLESSNEAAVTLADFLGRDRFVRLMNDKARALGMVNSALVDPAGEGDGNTATAEDLFALSKYLYGNRKFILRISSGKLKVSSYGSAPWNDLENFNIFGSPSQLSQRESWEGKDFVGGKVGKTGAAGETSISIFDLELNGEARPVAIIVLGSEDSAADAKALLGYIKTNY